ncbi:hypothetical protein H5410_056496 [Solanum commersonii]|uniref:Uncharacterized protein n=1 Tax=Solanum commersonii TaxID=4109 RepID=A0A9J5WLG5_SOLCO|nr:hypothetical protein H5410_056496 [Solanum commersonii]
MDYSTCKSSEQGVYPLWRSFDHENSSVFPFGPIGSIAKVLKDIHKKFGKMTSEIWITKRHMDYSTRKSAKRGAGLPVGTNQLHS